AIAGSATGAASLCPAWFVSGAALYRTKARNESRRVSVTIDPAGADECRQSCRYSSRQWHRRAGWPEQWPEPFYPNHSTLWRDPLKGQGPWPHPNPTRACPGSHRSKIPDPPLPANRAAGRPWRPASWCWSVAPARPESGWSCRFGCASPPVWWQ
uniref:Secreted protein n=1 Tax=Parastrongyloides trichosuri TaxID=131310 RepID=A0A0N4ZXT6_PARTI